MEIAQLRLDLAYRFKDWLCRRSISKRLLSILVFQTFLMIVWCGFIVGLSFQAVSRSVAALNSRLVNTVALNFQSGLATLEAVTKYPIIRSPIDGEPPYTYQYLSKRKNSISQAYDFQWDVQENVQRLLNLYPLLKSVVVYGMDGVGVRMDRNSATPAVVKSSPLCPWMIEAWARRGRIYILPQKEVKLSPFCGQTASLVICRSIVNSDNLDNVGLIVASCDMRPAVELFEQGRAFPSQRLLIFDRRSFRMLGTDDEGRALAALASGIPEGEGADLPIRSGTLSLDVAGRRMLYEYSTEAREIACVIETSPALVAAKALNLQVWLFALLLLLIAVSLSSMIVVIKSVTEPIKGMVMACERISAGDFSTELQVLGNDEFTVLSRSFNTMVSETRNLIYEGYEKDLLRNQLEIQMLRLQMNPHFLYNTLESIRAAAFLHGEEELSEMAALLGKLLRNGLASPEDTATVRAEVNHLEAYLRLQKLRYRDQMVFHVNVEESIMDLVILKLALQPVVENAICHGAGARATGGVVDVRGYREDGCLVFKVTDNGEGMDEERLSELREYIAGRNSSFSSIGLRNVDRRIKLYYGEDEGDRYGLKLDSIPGRGTVVSVVLPARTAMEDYRNA